tara:strand:- start:2603 stop:3289 length:687 start_codon:yes stop_codon:yes gene_type:complete
LYVTVYEEKISGTCKMSEQEAPTAEFCKDNINDPRCSCYNVAVRGCDTDPSMVGCAEGKEWAEQVIKGIPISDKYDSQRRVATTELNARLHCAPGVCNGSDKYKPVTELQDLNMTTDCNYQIKICASEVDIGLMTDSTMFVECNLNEPAKEYVNNMYQNPNYRDPKTAATVAAAQKIYRQSLIDAAAKQERLKKEKELMDAPLFNVTKNQKYLIIVAIILILFLFLVF